MVACIKFIAHGNTDMILKHSFRGNGLLVQSVIALIAMEPTGATDSLDQEQVPSGGHRKSKGVHVNPSYREWVEILSASLFISRLLGLPSFPGRHHIS
ncbi:hypothetical protein SCA6_002433 [Theobroma cacao]